jgi:hypothetical protein
MPQILRAHGKRLTGDHEIGTLPVSLSIVSYAADIRSRHAGLSHVGRGEHGRFPGATGLILLVSAMWNDNTAPAPEYSRSRVRSGAVGLWRRLLEIDYEAVVPRVRGFSVERTECVERIRDVGSAFLDGYHCALAARSVAELCGRLDSIGNELRGFAYEGAGMAVAILDYLSPWRRGRFAEFMQSEDGDRHVYMLHVGRGWACARLPGSPERAARRSESPLAWLVVDGYGFHEGFFHHRKYLGSPRRPRHLSGYGRRVFDQGLGRSFWFVFGSDAGKIAAAIGEMAPERQADLWSGVGLGCAYAGGSDRENIDRLAGLGERFLAELAQGASFGAKARERGGNLAGHVEVACQVLCGSSAVEAARVTDEVLVGIDQSRGGDSYEEWRRGITNHYKNEKDLCYVRTGI